MWIEAWVKISFNLEKSILEKKRTWTGRIWSFLTICFTILGIIFSIVDAIIKVIKVSLHTYAWIKFEIGMEILELLLLIWKVTKPECIGTGKSLLEALIFAPTNPQYDKRLFIDLPFQYMKTTSSEHRDNMLCA